MKNITKALFVVVALVLALTAFTACELFITDCEHTGGTATCDAAAVCDKCGESYGEALGHAEETVAGKDATCTEAGFTAGTKCSVCEEVLSGMEEIPMIAHTYDNACDADCNVCDSERTPDDHVYDNACDANCNVCDGERTPDDHVYDNACDVDCNVCDETRTPDDHVYDNACDGNCNVCDGERTPEDHVYDNACDANCNVCDGERTPDDHVYDNACDANCNVCDGERTPDDHVYDNACDAECNVCRAIRQVGDHVYSACDDTDCDECGEPRAQGKHIYDDCEDTTCNSCNAERVAPGHSIVIDEKKDPTCEETGLEQGEHCTECDYKVAQEEIPALNHAYSEPSYKWSDDNSTCAVIRVCANDAEHIVTEETATVSTVTLKVTATKVTYTYNVVFANSEYAAQTKTFEASVTPENSIATVNAPAIAGRVASHDYVKFGFHDATATYDFTIYYSECDVWDGTSVSTGLEGEGTEDNPYLIQSGADLAYVAKVVNDAAANTANFKGKYFKMTKSIDLNDNELKIGGYTASKVFHGYFDGNNCVVKGIKATQSLFGMLKDGYIKNLSTYGTVTTTEKKGVAGLVSFMSGATVENITNYVNVTGIQQVAGVVGWLENTTTTFAKNCVNYGTIYATSYQIGGIAGFAKGSLSGCTNFGDVTSTGSGYVGGIGGAAKDAKGSRSDCVNYGNISGTDYVGGCFGQITGTTTDCYGYGTATAPTANDGKVVGSGAQYLKYTTAE